MSTRALILGPHSRTGRISKATRAALDDLILRGYQPATSPEDENSAEARLRTTVATLPTVEEVILLSGWEDHSTTVQLASLALQLDIKVCAYTKHGQPLEPLDEGDLNAALTPGAGVVAPDTNPNEMPHEEAARIVLGPRAAYYDSPTRNFERIGLIWNGVLLDKLKDGIRITPEDVALCMVGLKLSRESFRHKRDNLTDAHGYLITLQMVLDERAAEDNK